MLNRWNQINCIVDARLEELLAPKTPELLYTSMAYSVRAGGKRLRPTLNIMAAELLTQDISETLDIACAIEMIHTYSLIHDDLPALDNDDMRRGVASNHIVFGEAQAILAGDGLLNYAYEVMLQNALEHRENLAAHVEAIHIVAGAAGVSGMIAGQVQDISLEAHQVSEEELAYIHRHKTGDLITGALASGLALYGPTPEQQEAIVRYGERIGLVFQIVDDILDVTEGAELGKTQGKDARDGKTTYVTMYGVDRATQLADAYNADAKDALGVFGARADTLRQMADFLLNRNK